MSQTTQSWSRLLVLVFVLTVTSSGIAEAYSPKQPVAHHRYSTNKKYYLDYDPQKGHRHVIRAVEKPEIELWSFASDALWPYRTDEMDGCLFVSNDGTTVAGLTWVPVNDGPEGHRIFEGLEFWRSDRSVTKFRVSDLPSWRVRGVDLPVFVLWSAIHGFGHRGQNMSRQDEHLCVRTFGLRSTRFSLRTGAITGWRINVAYLAYFAIIYGPPIFAVRRFLKTRSRTDEFPTGLSWRHHFFRSLCGQTGFLLAIANLAIFVVGILLELCGGTLDGIGVQFVRFAYPMAFVLIPVCVVISVLRAKSRPGCVDLIGPWLAIMAAASIQFFMVRF